MLAIIGLVFISLIALYLIIALIMYGVMSRNTTKSQFLDLSSLNLFMALSWPAILVFAIIEWVRK